MPPTITVTEFAALANQIFESSLIGITVVGEVAEFKISQGKWVFFKLKDDQSSIDCFMTIYQLRTSIEDGMRIAVKGLPKLTAWGKFSFTAQSILPVGEGSIKKSFELLKAKLSKEGLFSPDKKRPLPPDLTQIGVISSQDAAGYADFTKILNERSGGLHLFLAKTQVQGLAAADQIIRAIRYFNERSDVQLIAIIRGGGCKDDLAVFNDENLVRAIAASKIPIITGIGHEVDTSLADLAADIVASTPSNVAQLITRNKQEIIRENIARLQSLRSLIDARITQSLSELSYALQLSLKTIKNHLESEEKHLASQSTLLDSMNPETVLRRGYAMLSTPVNSITTGTVVKITTYNKIIETEVKNVQNRITK